MLATGFDDAAQIRAYSIGTSGGLFFALAFGMLTGRFITALHEAVVATPSARRRAHIWLLLFLVLSLALAVQAFGHYFTDVRADLFLIQQDEDGHLTGYQRVGNYMAIAFILNSALVARMYPHRRAAPWAFWSSVLLWLSLAFVLMPLAQLVGSNAGFALVAAFVLLQSTWLFVVRSKGFATKRLRIRLRDALLGWLGRRIVIAALLTAGALVLAGFVAVLALDVPGDSFRILGFGGESVDSIDTRAEIFRNNFITHLSYNPLLGNMRVDLLTTGEGTYVHSLLSLLTHLGVVGFALFMLFLRSLYLKIARPGRPMVGEVEKSYALFRLFALGTVLLAALFSAFFVWTPLWFCIGMFAFGPTLRQPRWKVAHTWQGPQVAVARASVRP
jgi:MFS family permease